MYRHLRFVRYGQFGHSSSAGGTSAMCEERGDSRQSFPTPSHASGIFSRAPPASCQGAKLRFGVIAPPTPTTRRLLLDEKH